MPGKCTREWTDNDQSISRICWTKICVENWRGGGSIVKVETCETVFEWRKLSVCWVEKDSENVVWW